MRVPKLCVVKAIKLSSTNAIWAYATVSGLTDLTHEQWRIKADSAEAKYMEAVLVLTEEDQKWMYDYGDFDDRYRLAQAMVTELNAPDWLAIDTVYQAKQPKKQEIDAK